VPKLSPARRSLRVKSLWRELEIALEHLGQVIILKGYVDHEDGSSSPDIKIDGHAVVMIEPRSHRAKRVTERPHPQK
jgi:hypothetical protein